MQPFIKARLVEGKEFIVNENHVAKVEKHKDGHAIITLSTGERIILISPSYLEWEGDTLIRKT